ncbi:MFS transporter [Galbitalea sp. SE-J8]|uniref:MFS transporter n=1 Tax=Galbitalea sp. SE-J8 TaxID=3054952 RepID=UPI00259D00B3|nr:MFS transporter [Galbitalea sp. SE-J8]MDM4763828.1 MFS transporter [Galbitalea sp. SE-J8]
MTTDAIPVQPATASATRATRAWPPVLALASGTAVLVTSEFLPAGVLPTIASDLNVSVGTAGWAVAVTAIAGAVIAPTIAGLLPRADRHRVLVALLLAGILANVVVALSPNFAVMLLGRLVLGAALSGFWAFAFGVGVGAVPGRDRLVSTGLSFGVSFATVLGVPVGAAVADGIGWRESFWGAAALCALSALAVGMLLPASPAHPSAGFRMLAQAVARPRLMLGILFITLAAFANFIAYPYIRLAIDRVDASVTSPLLVGWGIGGLIGTLVAGALGGRLRVLAAVTPIVLAVALVTTAAASTTPLLVVGAVLWGFAFNIVPVFGTLWVTRAEPERAESAVALNVTAFQVAITVGAAVGGAIVDSSGVQPTLIVGAVAAVLAGIGFAVVRLPRA